MHSPPFAGYMSGLALLAAAVLGPPVAKAAKPFDVAELATAVPADAMAVMFGRPVAGTSADRGPGMLEKLGGLLAAGRRMGLIPERGQVLADIFASLQLLGRYPYAMVLLDIRSRPLGNDAYRLKDMQAALVLETHGDHGWVARRIQMLLNTYTGEPQSRLLRVGNKPAYFRLSDARLPAWCVVEWGTVGSRFIVSLGAGAFERMAAVADVPGASLASDAWYANAHTRCHGPEASLEITVDFARIERRLAEVVAGRPKAVLRRLGFGQLQRGLWTSGLAGRAVTGYALHHRIGGDSFVPISDPARYQPSELAAIPDAASTFTILSLGPADLIRRGRAAYLASQRPARQERLRKAWARLETELGIDFDAQVLDHLGDSLIFHTYPPHPLGIPLLGTMLIEIRDQPDSVRAAVDALCSAWRDELDRPPTTTRSVALRPQLHRADDGVWYVQMGIYGPALAVTDHWVVISFSPEAVRANLRFLKAGTPRAALTGEDANHGPAQ